MNIIKISNAEKGSSNISSKDCTKVCRTCLKQDGLLNLFEMKQNDLSLNDLFVIFSIFQADPEDGFPQTICNKCAKAIRTMYSFKKRVEENQLILKLASLKAQNLDTSFQSKDSLLVTIVERPEIQNEYENDIWNIDAHENTGFDDDFTENKENIEITNNPLPKLHSNIFNIDLPLDHDYVKKEQEYTFYNYDGKNEEPETTCNAEEVNCSHCNQLFNSKQEYLIHMAAVSKEKSDLPKTKPSKIKKVNLTCHSCKITFQTRYEYTEHKNVCSANIIDLTESANKSQNVNMEFTCPYCKTLFHSRGEYMKHRKEEARKKSICPYCKKIVHTSKFDNHLRLIHKKLPPLKCDTCGKRFVSEAIYNTHVKGHKDGFFCEICGRKVLTEYALKSHKKIHERTKSPEKQVFECNICNKVIKHLYLYREHMYTHTGVSPYLCSTCGSTFKSQARLHQHTLIKHTERPFVCSICGNNYQSESKLQKHLERHDEMKNHKCWVCTKQFMKKSSLVMHLKSHEAKREGDSHDEIKTEVVPHYTKGNESQRRKIHCMSCGKEYLSTGLVNFQIHVRTHLGESPFLCLLCGKRFTDENEFSFHKEIHGNQKLEKIYFCQYCQKINASKAALRNHLRYHTGEKPFPCNICGKSFFLKAHLNTHLFWHTGQKPFGCNYCDKSFGMKGNLEQHERTHLGQRNYTCTICQKSFYTNSSLRKHQQVHFKSILGQDMPII